MLRVIPRCVSARSPVLPFLVSAIGVSIYFNQSIRSFVFSRSARSMASSNVYADLPNGRKIPMLGLGTWNSKQGLLKTAVMSAIDVGYRHIDCAYDYQNYGEVGEGIRAKIAEGKVTREDIFYTDKLWCTFHHPDDVEPACRHTIEKTGLEYIDLWLMHWPMAFKRGDAQYPTDDKGNYFCEDIDYTETWKAMEKVYEKGLVRAIGVSNLPLEWLQRVLDVSKVPIANLQVELHPYLTQVELVEFCKSKGITVTAYSPLGSPNSPDLDTNRSVPIDDPVVIEMAKKKGKTPAQILIRFQMQRGINVVPKSTNATRIAENFESYNFELTEGEMAELLSLNKNMRFVKYHESFNSPLHPFSPENMKK
ncbi:1,5-anhydro-D-fructose reductase-like [Amphiura filiformis]|uniref:1,5-anhydro-D-fructose reductase-like n=1 Tax=Amphiura filiformis TaxID=82378 RepID=UPI003B20C094